MFPLPPLIDELYIKSINTKDVPPPPFGMGMYTHTYSHMHVHTDAHTETQTHKHTLETLKLITQRTG